MPSRSKEGRRRFRDTLAIEGECKTAEFGGTTLPTKLDIPKSGNVSSKGVGVSEINEPVAGDCGIASDTADAARVVGSVVEEAASGVNTRSMARLSVAEDGNPKSAGCRRLSCLLLSAHND
jgi:hypothetical protein